MKQRAKIFSEILAYDFCPHYDDNNNATTYNFMLSSKPDAFSQKRPSQVGK